MTRLLARLPIRVRVTLAFTVAMGLLFGALALFLIVRLDAQLDDSVDQNLRTRAADLRALVKQSPQGFDQADGSPLTERGESAAQLLSADGRVLDAPPPLREQSLITREEVRRARRGTVVLPERRVPGSGSHNLRLLATPTTSRGRPVVIVVGQSLQARDEATDRLERLLILGTPIALLLASGIGFLATTLSLSPVQSMTRRARQVGTSKRSLRLPVPATQDEIRLLADTLNDMLARLEAAFDRERAFVSDASHELRTPLAILKGELELALKTAQTPEDYRLAVESAAEETDRVVQLAEDLLVIARADQGQLPVRPVELPTEELLESVAGRYARAAADRGVTLTVRAPESLTVTGDELRLEQALGNLVDNALRHTDGEIRMTAAAQNGHVVLTVADDGEGFPADFLEHAFERFSRADSARSRGGTGLGLAIVEAIIHAHGGSTDAENAPAGGARVHLRLPA